jgi:hypothetical protein
VTRVELGVAVTGERRSCGCEHERRCEHESHVPSVRAPSRRATSQRRVTEAMMSVNVPGAPAAISSGT